MDRDELIERLGWAEQRASAYAVEMGPDDAEAAEIVARLAALRRAIAPAQTSAEIDRLFEQLTALLAGAPWNLWSDPTTDP